MIKCNNCGRDNNDGSHVCLYCRASLEKTTAPTLEPFSPVAQESPEAQPAETDSGKHTASILLIVVLVLFIGVAMIMSSQDGAVVDNELLGTWQTAGYGYVDSWTFKKDGSYTMTRTFANSGMGTVDNDGYYRAENGMLKISYAKNIDKYPVATYTYQFGISESGDSCIVFTLIHSDGAKTTEILYKTG